MRLGVDLKEKGVKKMKLRIEEGKWRIVPNFESRRFDEGKELMGKRRWDGTYLLIHDKGYRHVCLDMSSVMGFRVQGGECWSITPIEKISAEFFLIS
jgi:3-dehydroquinate synthase class II